MKRAPRATPLVSAVINVYNGEPFIGDAVRSMLAQTYRDLEVIVVDDGSTDGTRDVLQAIAREDGRLQIHARAHSGISDTLNYGCSLARGRYIARLDADDLAEPQRIEQQVAYLERHPHIGLLGTAVRFLTPDGRVSKVVRLLPTRDASIRKALRKYCCFVHSSVTMRTDVFHAVGGYRVAFVVAEDYDLWVRCAARTRMANLEEPLSCYRLHVSQTSVDKIEPQALAGFAISYACQQGVDIDDEQLARHERVGRELLHDLGATDLEISKRLLDEYCSRLWLLHELGMPADALLMARETFQSRERLNEVLMRMPTLQPFVAEDDVRERAAG